MISKGTLVIVLAAFVGPATTAFANGGHSRVPRQATLLAKLDPNLGGSLDKIERSHARQAKAGQRHWVIR